MLRDRRREAGYSQEALAERAGLSASAIAALEQGIRRAPYRDTVNALADALALSGVARREFEELAATARRRHRRSESDLPVSLTSFVERDEVDELMALLRDRRLLTITGAGGVGKTRIAVEAARRLEHGYDDTFFVDLLPIRDGSMVAPHIAAVLNVPGEGEAALVGVVHYLRRRRALLVLDNCEHVVADAASAISVLLRGCPLLTILATSREPLALSGETVFRLSSMDSDVASELFITRARSVDPALSIDSQRLEIIMDICKRLDGIPLAIELAASRLMALGFEELRNRLKSGISLIGSRDLTARHQTMTATIAWSYDLLSTEDQLIFQRLSVFAGGFALQAAEDLCANESLSVGTVADGVSHLVQKSLLTLERDEVSARYRFLESIRLYAWERLSESRHLEVVMLSFMHWLHQKGSALTSSPSNEVFIEARVELDNVAAAVAWAELTCDAKTLLLAARILFGFRRVWRGTNRELEVRKLAFGLLDRLRRYANDDDAERSEVEGRLLYVLTPHLTGSELSELAPRMILLLTSAGDKALAANVVSRLAVTDVSRGDAAGAEEHLATVTELLDTNELRQKPEGIVALLTSAYVRCLLKDFSGAKAILAQLEIPTDDSSVVEAKIVLADIEFSEGNVERATELLRDIEPELHRYHDATTLATQVYGNLGAYRLFAGDVREASDYLRVALRYIVDARDYGFLTVTIEYARNAAAVAALTGRAELAIRLLAATETAIEQTGRRPSLYVFGYDLAMREIEEKVPPADAEALRVTGADEDLYELMEEFLVQLTADDSVRSSSALS